MIAGDFDQAIEAGLLAAKGSSLRRIYLSQSMRPAIWSRNLGRMREIADLLDAAADNGRDAQASRIASRAAIAALEGRTDEAVGGYRQALVTFRSMDADLLVAGHDIDLVTVIGPDHSAAVEAAAEARPILERIQARAYLAQLDAALAGSPTRTSPVPESAAVH